VLVLGAGALRAPVGGARRGVLRGAPRRPHAHAEPAPTPDLVARYTGAVAAWHKSWRRVWQRLRRDPAWRARAVRALLFYASSVNVARSVLRNEHGAAVVAMPWRSEPRRSNGIYRRLFYFARLRPRILCVSRVFLFFFAGSPPSA